MTKVIGNYELEEEIWKSKNTTVYKAKNITSKKYFACKNIEFAGSSTQQAINQRKEILEVVKKTQTKEGNYIVKCYEALYTRNNVYIIMELCEGGNLSQMLEQRIFCMNEDEILKILQEIIQGYYSCIYLKKIIHLDLKPQNILFQKGNPKISDFEISVMQKIPSNQASEIMGKTRDSISIPSTIPFVSPQIMNKTEFTYKTDIYSLGVMLYFMLYGSYPQGQQERVVQEFQQRIKERGIESQLNFPPRLNNRKVSLGVERLIQWMMEYDESDRISIEQLIHHKLIIKKQEGSNEQTENSSNKNNSSNNNSNLPFSEENIELILNNMLELCKNLQLIITDLNQIQDIIIKFLNISKEVLDQLLLLIIKFWNQNALLSINKLDSYQCLSHGQIKQFNLLNSAAQIKANLQSHLENSNKMLEFLIAEIKMTQSEQINKDMSYSQIKPSGTMNLFNKIKQFFNTEIMPKIIEKKQDLNQQIIMIYTLFLFFLKLFNTEFDPFIPFKTNIQGYDYESLRNMEQDKKLPEIKKYFPNLSSS